MISENSQCGSYLFDGFQHTGPFGDARNFTRVNAKGFAIEQESEIFHVRLFKCALLGFKKEGLLFKKVEDIMYNLSVEGRVVWSSD